MQIFKALRSERSDSPVMVQGFKSWSSLCESQTAIRSNPHTPLATRLRSPGSSLYAGTGICAFSLCCFFFCCCFFTVCREGEEPKIQSQIKPLRPGAICYYCLLSWGPRHTLWLNTVCLKKKVYLSRNERYFLVFFHPLLFWGRNLNGEV